MERSPLRHIEPSRKRQETGPARVNKARLPRNLEDPFDLNYKRETGLDTPLPLGKVKPETRNNEGAEMLEMTDEDFIPKGDDLSALLAAEGEEPLSRQQRRAEARQTEKKSRRAGDKITPPPLPPSGIKKPRGFYPPGSLPEVMARMDKVEKELERLNNGHAEIVTGTREIKETLARELEDLRKSLTTTPKESSPPPTTLEAAQPIAQEEPEMSWNEEEIDNPDFVTERPKPSRSKKKVEQKPALEGQALLESLANKYGIILSPEARAARLQELEAIIDPAKVAEEARLEELLAGDEETLRDTEDITDSNKESLSGRIKETKKRLALLSKELNEPRDEKDTLLEYPTAAEEVEFNMAETIDEIARTNPKNAIRLRQLHNTFADLEQMKELLANEEDPKGPPPLPKRETSGAIRERLAERLGIILDHGEREANIIAIQNEIRDIGTAFVEVDKEIEPLEDRLAKTRIFKVHDQLEKEIKPLKERREKIKNRYDNAADRYNEAAIFPTAQEELEARLQMLRIARENDPKDRASVDGEINDLEHLKKLLPPPLPRREGAVLENKETGADRPKEMETLAESLGIILDPEKRQDHIDKLDDICGEIGEKIGKLDEEISRLQVKLEEVHDSEMRKDAIKALKLAEREKHQLKAKFDEAWEEEYQYRNRFPDASYEIRERIISLRADKEDDTNLNDKKLIDERIDALSRLRKLFDAEKEAKEQKGVGNLGLNYSYTPEAHIVDEKELADVVIPQEEDVDTTSWNKYVAPPGERGIPPRRLPGQTRESLIGRVDQIDAMIKTGRAADGTTMSSPIRQQLERGRAALARRLETMQTTSTEEENDNGRISGTREAFLPFRTSGSLDSKTLEEDQLITEHEVAKTERAQTREANAQVYKMRAQEYKKDLRTIVKALAQQGETVEIPGEPGVIAEPEKKSWISSVWTKIKNRREIATLKQQYETALERYEEAEQQRTAVERDIPVFEKARIAGRQGGFAESSKTLDKRFNEKSRFEQAVDTLKRVRDQGREVSNYLLTGKSPDGQTLTDKDKNNLRKEFIKEVLAVQKQITPEDSQLLEKAMEEVDEIYYPVTKLESSNIGLLQKFELTPEDRKGIEDIKDASLRQLKTLEAKASAGKTREEREQAQADLRGIKRDLGGKTVKEIHANLVHSVEAAMQLRALEMEPVSKKRLVHNYRERLRSIEQNLDLKDEVKVTLKNIQADLARAA